MKHDAAWTAFSWNGRPICYQLDGDHIEARELGHKELLPITDELRAGIAADQAHQRAKSQGQS